MTPDRKAFYNRLPVGEWIERDKIMNHQSGNFKGSKIWGFQRALQWFHQQKLIQLKFVDGIQYIRRIPLTEVQYGSSNNKH